MIQNIQIQPTLDGSQTFFLPDLNETYHSLNGALSESLHVYIENGLKLINSNQIEILEIGFGSGLNALLSLNHQQAGSTIHYTSIEPFLIDSGLLMSYYSKFEFSDFDLNLLQKMLDCKHNETIQLTDNFSFTMLNDKLQNLNLLEIYKQKLVNLVYYDAFAPSRQAEMWSKDCFESIEAVMDENGLLTTYCAQGQFKRTLKELGFKVTQAPGANGKREMTIAYKNKITS